MADIIARKKAMNIKNDQITEKAVTPEKTSFTQPSKNLFNKYKATEGKRLSSGGAEIDDANYVLTDFISIAGNTEIKRSELAEVTVYNQNKSYVTMYPNNTAAVTLHPDTRYMRVATTIARSETLQVEKGSVSTEYEDPETVHMSNLKVQEASLVDATRGKIEKANTTPYFSSDNIPYTSQFPSNIMTVLGGNELDADVNFSDSTTKDYSIAYTNQREGYKITEVGTSLVGDLTYSPATPITIPKTAAVGIAVYIPDKENVQNFQFKITFSDKSVVWSRTKSKSQFKPGWNIFRFSSITMKPNIPVDETYLDDWGTSLSKIEVIPQFLASSASITVGKVWLEYNDKAQILFIDDGGYKSFLNIGYPELQSRNIPVTWALNPGILGSYPGNYAERISEADVDSLMLDANSYFSFHTWASNSLKTATEQEVREDALKCVRWLRSKGLIANDVFRGAVVQNDAPQWQGMKGIVQATRTWKNSRGFDVFPFLNRWDVPTDSLHAMGNDDGTGVYSDHSMDSYFRVLQETNALLVVYTHGISLNTGDVDPVAWDHFLAKIDEGITGGWLEGVSYDLLRTRMTIPQEHNDREAIINATK